MLGSGWMGRLFLPLQTRTLGPGFLWLCPFLPYFKPVGVVARLQQVLEEEKTMGRAVLGGGKAKRLSPDCLVDAFTFVQRRNSVSLISEIP